MYTLTGNYKADQVHAPALIERLGQWSDDMQYGIAFTPLVPSLRAVARARRHRRDRGCCCCSARARGAAVRVTALALILLALANPSFTREDREPLSSVAAVVIDKSPSQNFGERNRGNRASAGGAGRQPQEDQGAGGAGRRSRPGRRRNRWHADCSARCRRRCRTFRSIASPAPS